MMAFVAHGHHYLWDRYWATPPKDRPAEIVKTLAEADSVRGKDGMMPSFFLKHHQNIVPNRPPNPRKEQCDERPQVSSDRLA